MTMRASGCKILSQSCNHGKMDINTKMMMVSGAPGKIHSNGEFRLLSWNVCISLDNNNNINQTTSCLPGRNSQAESLNRTLWKTVTPPSFKKMAEKWSYWCVEPNVL